MIKVGIMNATGYIGVELVRLLKQHPEVDLVSVTGRSGAGKELGEFFPHLAGSDLTIEADLGEVDLAFCALPHGDSARTTVAALEKDIRVIDVSADFRLKSKNVYEQWYNVEHPAPELLDESVYGLPEIYRNEISKARLVANPGCYPTSVILALAPALREGLIDTDIIIDSKSGLSGAGRALSLATHYAEANENVEAYSVNGHRHLPEIVQELQNQAGDFMVSAVFIPHLVPMTRGIFSSCYTKMKTTKTEQEIREVYRHFYQDEPFVRIVDAPSSTKQTWGSNTCIINPTLDSRTGKLMVFSAIDNLVKGGAGQAVQNMNLMLGFPEDMGLRGTAVYP